MAGYSGTPLLKKLGIKPGFRVAFVDAPDDLPTLLGELPADVQMTSVGPLDLAACFVTSRRDLELRFEELSMALTPSGMLWVAWPKRTSGVATDLTDHVVREVGLKTGLVDVKVCAIDETWSGLKFVVRVKDRPKVAR